VGADSSPDGGAIIIAQANSITASFAAHQRAVSGQNHVTEAQSF